MTTMKQREAARRDALLKLTTALLSGPAGAVLAVTGISLALLKLDVTPWELMGAPMPLGQATKSAKQLRGKMKGSKVLGATPLFFLT